MHECTVSLFSKEAYSFLFIFQLAELFAFSWTFGEFLCKFVNYMQNVSAVSSVLNLTVMSIERYEIMFQFPDCNSEDVFIFPKRLT